MYFYFFKRGPTGLFQKIRWIYNIDIQHMIWYFIMSYDKVEMQCQLEMNFGFRLNMSLILTEPFCSSVKGQINWTVYAPKLPPGSLSFSGGSSTTSKWHDISSLRFIKTLIETSSLSGQERGEAKYAASCHIINEHYRTHLSAESFIDNALYSFYDL